MMNLLALGLLAASLAVAGVLSPIPAPPHPNSNPHLIHEGHRLIVVEYERHLDDSSPPSPTTPNQNHGYPDATSLLPNYGEGLSTPLATETSPQVPHFVEQAKDKASQLEQSINDAAKHVADKAKEKYHETDDWIRSTVERSKGKAEDAKIAAEDVIRKASEKAEHAKHATENVMEKASERAKDAAKSIKEKTDEVKAAGKHLVDSASKKAEELREKKPLKDAIGVTMEGREDLFANISSIAHKAAEKKAGEVAAELKKDATEIIRRMQSLVYTLVVYVTTPELAKTAAAVVHLLGFVTAYGAGLWVTFASSHVLARALPRQQFGVVQSKLYPVYFRVVVCGVAVAFLARFFGGDLRPVAERVRAYNLLAVLGLVLVNMLLLEPKATKAMFERTKMEKEEGRGRDMADIVAEPPPTAAAGTGTSTFGSSSFGLRRRESTADQETASSRMEKLNNRLKKLNTYSSLLNMVALMGLTLHLVHLARSLHPCT